MKRKYQIQISQPTAGGRRSASSRTGHQSRRNGSALILAVVLTTLLATVGVLFVLLSRIDKMAASAASQNRELNFAIDTVVAKISQELVLDVPGVDPNVNVDYYDYPGPQDRWLASLEPYKYDINDYRWQQISDVTEFMRNRGVATQFVKVDPPGNRKVINEYPEIKLAINGELDDGNPDDGRLNNELRGQLADADGDGIADSKWVQLDDITSSKGKPIYAAVRIIDNGGMLNANTAYKFDPTDPCATHIDGSSQMQINLAGFVRGSDNVDEIHIARCGSGSSFWIDFQNNVIWRIESPAGGYLPFDISDELELRYRYCINWIGHTRLENIWFDTIGSPDDFQTVPYDGYRDLAQPPKKWRRLDDWCPRVTCDSNAAEPDTRHLLTTCNMDRIINPARSVTGGRMVNINTTDKNSLYSAIYAGLSDANFAGNRVETAAQVAVNLIDYRDSDDNNNVTSFAAPDGKIYYGFERPCIYISELDYNQVTIMTGSPPTQTIHKSYAVELYKPYSEDSVPGSGFWQVAVDGASINIDPWPAGKSFCVIRNQDPAASISVDANAIKKDWNQLNFAANRKIELQRKVTDPNGASKYIAVDSIWVPTRLVTGNGLRSYQRDITKHKCIRRLWDPGDPAARTPMLGSINSYVDSSTGLIQARPANRPFTNIGEIGMIFRMSAYSQGPNPIGPIDNELTARLNLINPAFQQIFNYLTVIDPADHGQPSSETRIKGRINVNTAPWFVIAQLPWMRYNAGVDEYSRAKAITRYRDTVGGFKSTAELMQVSNMQSLGSDGLDNLNSNVPKGPDLTDDTARDDFEERDVIFARISNLVTVRSDIFTAYILARIGPNGPQRRVLAILDRSNVYYDSVARRVVGKVKTIALQPVPDPR